MKYLIKSILTLILALSLTFSLASCLGDNDDIGEDGHTHEWGEPTLLEAPTCEGEGYNEYSCSICSESKYEAVAPTGHLWNFDGAAWSWDSFGSAEVTVECQNTPSHTEIFAADISSKITKQPTYSATGIKTYTASVTIGSETLTSSATEVLAARPKPNPKDEEFVDYSTFQAEYYAKEYLKRTTSYGSEYLSLLENDKGFMGSVLAWESLHLLVDPTYETGQLKKKDLYTLVIYDIMTGESGKLENSFSLLEDETAGYMSDVANLIFGDGMTTQGALNAMKVIEPSEYITIIKNSAIFSTFDLVQNIFAISGNLFEAAQMLSYCEALSNMSNSYKFILNEICNDSQNDPALRDAASDIFAAIDDMIAGMIEELILEEWADKSLPTLFKLAYDKLWSSITKIYFPHLLVAQVAAKGAMILTDAMFDIDANILAYYQLKVAVGFENALRRGIENNAIFDYSVVEYQDISMSAADLLHKTVILGYDYSIELLNETLDTVTLSKENKARIREYITEISDLRIRVDEIDEMFENTCMNLYEAYLKLDLHNLSPVDTVMIFLRLGKYEGSYTAPQGLQGVKVHIWEKRELLENESALAEYARIATEYEAKKLDGGATVTAEDIEYKISSYVYDYIVIIEFFPTVANPDVECGLYISEISYDYQNGYNICAREWIQHNSYYLADFLYLEFANQITGKVYGQIGDVIFGSYVEVGDITLDYSAS